jgi:hypothetical protein
LSHGNSSIRAVVRSTADLGSGLGTELPRFEIRMTLSHPIIQEESTSMLPAFPEWSLTGWDSSRPTYTVEAEMPIRTVNPNEVFKFSTSLKIVKFQVGAQRLPNRALVHVFKYRSMLTGLSYIFCLCSRVLVLFYQASCPRLHLQSRPRLLTLHSAITVDQKQASSTSLASGHKTWVINFETKSAPLATYIQLRQRSTCSTSDLPSEPSSASVPNQKPLQTGLFYNDYCQKLQPVLEGLLTSNAHTALFQHLLEAGYRSGFVDAVKKVNLLDYIHGYLQTIEEGIPIREFHCPIFSLCSRLTF